MTISQFTIFFITVAGWVIAVIVVILLVAVGVSGGVFGIYFIWHFCCRHKESQLFYVFAHVHVLTSTIYSHFVYRV